MTDARRVRTQRRGAVCGLQSSHPLARERVTSWSAVLQMEFRQVGRPSRPEPSRHPFFELRSLNTDSMLGPAPVSFEPFFFRPSRTCVPQGDDHGLAFDDLPATRAMSRAFRAPPAGVLISEEISKEKPAQAFFQPLPDCLKARLPEVQNSLQKDNARRGTSPGRAAYASSSSCTRKIRAAPRMNNSTGRAHIKF